MTEKILELSKAKNLKNKKMLNKIKKNLKKAKEKILKNFKVINSIILIVLI